MKILIIEEHSGELKLVHHVLSAAGHSVSGAASAESVLTSIKIDRPDLILLDMSLPGMDGLTLVRRLKADETVRDIPIVAVTSYPENYPKEEALRAGCDVYFLKPLSTRTLPEALLEVIESRKSGR